MSVKTNDGIFYEITQRIYTRPPTYLYTHSVLYFDSKTNIFFGKNNNQDYPLKTIEIFKNLKTYNNASNLPRPSSF